MIKLFDSLTAGLPFLCCRLLLFTALLTVSLARPLENGDVDFVSHELDFSDALENTTASNHLNKRDDPTQFTPMAGFSNIKLHSSCVNDPGDWGQTMNEVETMVCLPPKQRNNQFL